MSDDRGPAPGPGLLSVGDVAARLGVSPATVRSWERRYGLAPGARSAGGHRRWTADEVAVLDRMHALVLRGETPARAALLARSPDAAAGAPRGRASGRGGPGGRVLAVRGAGRAAAGLARAATRLDVDAVEAQVLGSLRDHGTSRTWSSLLRPVLVAAGEHWAATGSGIEVEHLLTEATLGALRQYRYERAEEVSSGGSGHPRAAVTARPVLLACAPHDQHTLVLHLLAAALTERGVKARVMGARVPVEALSDAAARTGAAAVFVWSQLDAGDVDLAGVPTTRPPLAVVVGGPGWEGRDLGPRARAVDSLDDAVAVLTGAAARG